MFSCNQPPALLAEWPLSFTCYCGNAGVERKVGPGEENFPAAPAGTRTQHLSITSPPRSTSGLSPLLDRVCVGCGAGGGGGGARNNTQT